MTVCISSHNKFIFYSLFFKKGRIKLSNIVKYELSQKMFCCCTVQYLLIIKIDLLLVSRLSFIDCRITSFVLMIEQMKVYLVYIGLFQNILIREKVQYIKCSQTITSRKIEENIFMVWNIALHWSNFSCCIIFLVCIVHAFCNTLNSKYLQNVLDSWKFNDITFIYYMAKVSYKK